MLPNISARIHLTVVNHNSRRRVREQLTKALGQKPHLVYMGLCDTVWMPLPPIPSRPSPSHPQV